MASRIPHQPLPIDQSDVRYAYGPDSVLRDGVAPGRTTSFRWDASRVYPGTSRTVWVHVPAAYDPAEPAGLMVFQDGWLYLDPAGEVRAGVVLDNLVHHGDIPMTIGVFVEPGTILEPQQPGRPKQRNLEYDAFDERYGSLLLDEILPEVTGRYRVRDDPDRWGVCGGSSGGNAALTAAWLRPDRFRRVVAFVSSFAQMQGGNPYPDLFRKAARRPLKVFLQAGHRDLGWNQTEGNWLAENLEVAAALARAGYDFRLVLGDGGHSPNHAGVLLPDALRWVWGDA